MRVLLSFLLIQLAISGCGKTRDTYPIPTAIHDTTTDPRGDSPLNAPFEPAIDWLRISYRTQDSDLVFVVRKTSAYFLDLRAGNDEQGRLPIEQFSEIDRRARVISKQDVRQSNCRTLPAEAAPLTVQAALANGGNIQLYTVSGTTECYRGDLTEVRALAEYLSFLSQSLAAQ